MINPALALAALLAAAPQNGTVYTADGGRLRGNVLAAGPGGVSVQLADGSTRNLDAAQVSRVDFADGTSWKPQAAAAAAAPLAASPFAAEPAAAAPAGTSAAAPAAVGLAGGAAAGGAASPNAASAGLAGGAPASAAAPTAAAVGLAGAGAAAAPATKGPAQAAPGLAPVTASSMATVGLVGGTPAPRPAGAAAPMVVLPERLDSVFLAKGGRVRGLVVEETQEVVVMRLVDGSERRLPAGQVSRIEYSDGSVASPPGAPGVKPGR